VVGKIGHGSAVVFMLGNLPVDMNWVTGTGFVLTFGHAETDILIEFRIKAHEVAPFNKSSKVRVEGGTDWVLDCSNMGEEKAIELSSR
jgi:hypothetical protein